LRAMRISPSRWAAGKDCKLTTSSEDIHTAIRQVEAEAWFDMFRAAPALVANELGMATHRTPDARYLACRRISAIPFNRGFAISGRWSGDQVQISDGISWLDRFAAPGWVLQIDEHGFYPSEKALQGRGVVQKCDGWMKLAVAPQGTVAANDPRVLVATTDKHAVDFANVVIVGFGLPSSSFEWFRALAHTERWSCYVAYNESTPCAAGAMFVSGQCAWLGIDATLKGYRAGGLQSALIARRLRDLSVCGARLAMAETGYQVSAADRFGSSFRNYQRAGFDVKYYTANFGRAAGIPTTAEPVLMM